MSDLTPSVLTARQRALYYRDASGISELVVGAALIVFGSQDYVSAKLVPLGHMGQVLVALGIILVYGLLMLGNKAIVEWLKERLIYPRTGYVCTPDEHVRTETERRGSFPIFLVLAAIIGFGFFASSFVTYARWIWSVGMFVLFASYVFVSGQFKLDPARSLLCLVPMTGGLAWWTFAKPSPPLDWLLVVVGASLSFTGLIRLLVYLFRNPRPTPTAP